MLNHEITAYVERYILPQYDEFDAAHNRAHALKVIASSLEIARDYDVDPNMVYVIAAYHDVGLRVERKRHGEISGEILAADAALKRWFSAEQIETMAHAATDHRASGDEPRTIYGRIVSEADRDIEYQTILRRTIEYSLANFPEYTMELHWQRIYEHIRDKYGESGYLKLWLSTAENERGLRDLRDALKEPDRMRNDFDEIFMLM